jgi:redox-sensing transcriptional repressor
MTGPVGAQRAPWRAGGGAGVDAEVPTATVARLPGYLRALHELRAAGVRTTSSSELAEASGRGPAQIRKDLSFLGSFGTRGVGYDVDALAEVIASALGLEATHRLAIVGIGNLGQALANYSGYADRGFEVVALFDTSPAIVGTLVGGLAVEPFDALERAIAREAVTMAIIATPGAVAQAVVERVIGAGVREILSFAPVSLQVPDDVVVRGLDVAGELQILAFHAAARTMTGSVTDRG